MKKTVIRSKTVWRVVTTQLRAQYILLALGLGALLLLPAISVLFAAGNEWYMKSLAGMLGFLKDETVFFCGMLPMMFFALLLAVLQFSYLFHRARVDGVHSLPVTRVELFLGRVGAAVLAMAAGAVLFAASALSALLFAVPQFFPDTWYVVLENAVMIFVGGLAIYFFTAMCAAFAGSVWEMVLSTAVLGLGGTVANVCVGWLVRASIPVSAYSVSGDVFSPYILPWETVVNHETWMLLPLALWIVVPFAVGFWGFCRRRSELGEGGFATGFQKLVRAVTALDAALVMSILSLYMFRSSYAMYVLCGAVAAIASGLVLHLLYTHSPKGMWKAARWSAAGLCAAAVLNLCVAMGWIGVPRIPEEDEVAAVRVDTSVEEAGWNTETGGMIGSYTETVWNEYNDEEMRFLNVETGEDVLNTVEPGSVDRADVQKAVALARSMLEAQRARHFPFLPQADGVWRGSTPAPPYKIFRLEEKLYLEGRTVTLSCRDLFDGERTDGMLADAAALASSETYDRAPNREAAVSAAIAIRPFVYSEVKETPPDLEIPEADREAVRARLVEAARRDNAGLPAPEDAPDEAVLAALFGLDMEDVEKMGGVQIEVEPDAEVAFSGGVLLTSQRGKPDRYASAEGVRAKIGGGMQTMTFESGASTNVMVPQLVDVYPGQGANLFPEALQIYLEYADRT